MKKLSIRFLSVFLFISWAWAIEFRSDDSVNVSTPLDETLAAAGGDLTISAPVDGDVFLAGNTITLSADVTEDVWMAGNILTTSATISDDLRAAGQILNIWGTVVWDVMLWGNTATISAPVWWDLYIWSNIATINWPVAGDAYIWSEKVMINSTISGDVIFDWGLLNFGEWAQIAGNLEIITNEGLPDNLSGVVLGSVNIVDKQENGREKKWEYHDHGDKWFGFNFYRFLTMAILWSLMIWFMPGYTNKAVGSIVSNPGKTFLYGLLMLICIPFVAMILLATGVWAPLGWWLLANYIFLWVFLGLFVVVYAADYLVDRWLHEYIGNTIRAKIAVIFVLSFVLTALPYLVTVILGLFWLWAGWLTDMSIIKNNK